MKDIKHKYPIAYKIIDGKLIFNDGQPIGLEYVKKHIKSTSANQDCELGGLKMDGDKLYIEYWFI